MEMFDLDGANAEVVLALHWEGRPEFRRIQALAEGIRRGMADRIQRGGPIYVILNADIALNLGALLREDPRIASDVMVIDGLTLWDFDYVDLGRLRLPSRTVPVTIKSLVFRDAPGGSRSKAGGRPSPRQAAKPAAPA